MKVWIGVITLMTCSIIAAGCAETVPAQVATPTMRPLKPTATKTTQPMQPTPAPTESSSIVLPKALPTCIDPDTVSSGTIIEIMDGDTIIANIGGVPQKVRYIGIDTPEIDSPGSIAQQANEANSAMTLGRQATFYSDVENTDMYDRLLRYVFVGDLFVNQALVASGLAEEQEYPPNTACAGMLNIAEEEAKEKNLGIWMLAAQNPNGGMLTITEVDKRAEVVTITNQGTVAINLNGWVLMSERGNQSCVLLGSLPAGVSVKIYAQNGADGISCGFKDPIWNNSEVDPAALFNPSGELVDRWEGAG